MVVRIGNGLGRKRGEKHRYLSVRRYRNGLHGFSEQGVGQVFGQKEQGGRKGGKGRGFPSLVKRLQAVLDVCKLLLDPGELISCLLYTSLRREHPRPRLGAHPPAFAGSGHIGSFLLVMV